MRIISWNCQGALRKKIDKILEYKPDILIVQECESKDKLLLNSLTEPNDFFWYGSNVHKGIAIFSYSEYRFELMEIFDPQFRYILPFRVKGYGQSFTLFAIWAMNNKQNRHIRYIGQVWYAIEHYSNLLEDPIIIMGDFNSNKIWDHRRRVGNHSQVVSKLSEKNIFSVYHKHSSQEQGEEINPTFFLQRNMKKPYHIDYCFVSADMYAKVTDIEIGDREKWIQHSDHLPLLINFNL